LTLDCKKTANAQTGNGNRQTGNDVSRRNVAHISLGKIVIFLLLIIGVLLFCLFPLHRDVVVSQLGPNFITRSESESDKRNMVLVENSEYLFQQKLNAVENKAESITQ
jgi:cell division septal protein FtsQ